MNSSPRSRREDCAAFEAAAAAAGVAATRVGEAVGRRRAARISSAATAARPRFRAAPSAISEPGSNGDLPSDSRRCARLPTRFLAACALARAAGEIAKRRFLDRASFTVGFKGPQDFLTEVDGEVERLIRRGCIEVFPGDGFIGEEGAGRVGAAGRAGLGRRPDRRHRKFRPRRAALLRLDRCGPRPRNRNRRHLRSDASTNCSLAAAAPARR